MINTVQAALFGDPANAGGYTYKQLVAHETLEAALEVLRKSSYSAAHDMTNTHPGFEGLESAPGMLYLFDKMPGTDKVVGFNSFWNITGTNTTMEIYLKLKTPIPEPSLRGRQPKAYPTSVKIWP
jgi:hypothetical protein